MTFFDRAFDDILRLQRAIDHALTHPYSGFGWPTSGGGVFPALNMFEVENALLLKAEIPGLDRSKLSVEVQGDRVTLAGARTQPALGEGRGYHRRERAFGEFRRVFRLPFEVDREKATADYKDGILTVRLEKAESAKPRQITVQG